MKKKYISITLSAFFLILIFIFVIVVNAMKPSEKLIEYGAFDNILKEKGLVGIGKQLTYKITNRDYIDYKAVEDQSENSLFCRWALSERKKLAQYMKDNNLRIKEGEYEINQGTSYERALEVLKFLEIK